MVQCVPFVGGVWSVDMVAEGKRSKVDGRGNTVRGLRIREQGSVRSLKGQSQRGRSQVIVSNQTDGRSRGQKRLILDMGGGRNRSRQRKWSYPIKHDEIPSYTFGEIFFLHTNLVLDIYDGTQG